MTSLVAQVVSPVETGHKVWQDQSFIKWRKRDPHVTLHCHESVEGSLRYWYQRNKVDHLVSNSAVWNDDAVQGALDCAAFWVKDLPFVQSLSGLWKFFLAPDLQVFLINFMALHLRTQSGKLYLSLQIGRCMDMIGLFIPM